MTYFEWAGMHHRQIIVPWRVIDGPETADAFAADIGRARYTRASRTSISGAMLFAMPLFEGSGYRGVAGWSIFPATASTITGRR